MVDSFAEILLKLMSKGFTSLTAGAFKLFDAFLGGMNQGFSSSWDNPIIQVFLFIFNWFSVIIFICSLFFLLLKIVQEQNRDWYTIVKCPVSAIVFIGVNQLIVRTCLLIPDMFIEGIGKAIGTFQPSDILAGFKSAVLGNVLIIAMIVAFAIFSYLTFMRFGAMLIQIMVAPFYVPYITTGDNQKASEWMLSTVAVGFTYMLQYMLFYGGFILLTYASDIFSQVISFSLIFATFKVSAQMQKFGWASGGGSTLNTAYMGANMIASLMKR